jgi:hypothetical protein
LKVVPRGDEIAAKAFHHLIFLIVRSPIALPSRSLRPMRPSPGILYLALIALAWGVLANACRRSADAANLQAVDSLITTVDAAILTLNELDPARFDRAAAAFAQREGDFQRRFQDTLERSEAELLGDQYLALNAADDMASDHRRTLQELRGSAERLRALRRDVMNAAMPLEEEKVALATETQVQQLLRENVDQTIANYRIIQQAWDRLPATDSLLTDQPNTIVRR